ncbi:conserved phage C-terminal domain-containing protein [Candidatus Pacearchaeota archaeon]|nr:conserved phage C-terminal domain-containing protein [Candidatus Pacearchaeota archaeon]
MTPAEEGGYVRLLCHAWNDPDCCLPADNESLMALSRLTDKVAITRVKDCFIAHPDKPGKLTHERLLKERKKQEDWREKCSKGGKKSAKSQQNKRKKRGKGSRKVVTRVLPVKGNTPSSSSTPSPSLSLSSSPTTPLREKISSGEPDHLTLNTFVNEVIRYLNEILKTRYRNTTPKTKVLIQARINQGHTLEEFKIVIDKKSLEWGDDLKMSKYLRPETLFGNKFESYLNQKEADKPKSQTQRNIEALKGI